MNKKKDTRSGSYACELAAKNAAKHLPDRAGWKRIFEIADSLASVFTKKDPYKENQND